MMYKAFISYKFFFQSICFDNLFPPNLLRMTQYNQFCSICNFSNLFPPKWLRITWNGQFCSIHNFSNLFPLKQLRITLNGQFCSIYNLSNLFPPKQLIFGKISKFFILGGGGRGTLNFGHVKSAISKEAVGLMAQLSM